MERDKQLAHTTQPELITVRETKHSRVPIILNYTHIHTERVRKLLTSINPLAQATQI